jgi:ABC-type transport system involved in multi-copper enzyme maturation permease subunit
VKRIATGTQDINERSMARSIFLFSIKTVHLNLLEHRFVTIIVFTLALFTFSTILNKAAYHSDLQSVNDEELQHNARLANAVRYRETILGLYRRPTPLSVLSPGARKKYGDVTYVGGLFPVDFPDPRTLKALSFATVNQLTELARRIDFPGIVILLLSLLTVLLVYDAISGERERGVLKLCLANNLPRYQLILGEYLGALFTLALPIALSVVVFLLIIRTPPPIRFSADDCARIALMLTFTFLFLSGFILAGLWVSTLSHTSATSLATGLCLWAIFAVIYPGSLPSVARRFSSGSGFQFMPSLQRWDQNWDPALDELAWRQEVKQTHLARNLELLMPTTSYAQAVQILAHTDPIAYVSFVEKARLLNSRLRSWQEDKIQRYPGRDKGYNPEWGPLDVTDLPVAPYRTETLEQTLSRALPNLITLFIFNVICFVGAVRSFTNYNPS